MRGRRGGMPSRSGSVGPRAARELGRGRVPPARGKGEARVRFRRFETSPRSLPRAGRALAGGSEARSPARRRRGRRYRRRRYRRRLGDERGQRAGASRCACASPRARGENRKAPRWTRGRAARAKAQPRRPPRARPKTRGSAKPSPSRDRPRPLRARRARGRRVTRGGPPKRFPGSFIREFLVPVPAQLCETKISYERYTSRLVVSPSSFPRPCPHQRTYAGTLSLSTSTVSSRYFRTSASRTPPRTPRRAPARAPPPPAPSPPSPSPWPRDLPRAPAPSRRPPPTERRSARTRAPRTAPPSRARPV